MTLQARRWVHPETRRWYSAEFLSNDLFGDACLLLRWGSLDSRRGGGRSVAVGHVDALPAAIAAVDKRRLARGYLPLTL